LNTHHILPAQCHDSFQKLHYHVVNIKKLHKSRNLMSLTL